MRLTDNEIRDITKLLEAGKPLPDEYRFLLFDDKREVELVWNGKTNEVCNVVLPFQIIEQVDEPRSEKEMALQADLFSPHSVGFNGYIELISWDTLIDDAKERNHAFFDKAGLGTNNYFEQEEIN